LAFSLSLKEEGQRNPLADPDASLDIEKILSPFLNGHWLLDASSSIKDYQRENWTKDWRAGNIYRLGRLKMRIGC